MFVEFDHQKIEYRPGDTYQALVMITGLIVALAMGALAKKPGMGWVNNFVMAGSMIVGMASSLLWTSIF